jgi:hypothetical protein
MLGGLPSTQLPQNNLKLMMLPDVGTELQSCSPRPVWVRWGAGNVLPVAWLMSAPLSSTHRFAGTRTRSALFAEPSPSPHADSTSAAPSNVAASVTARLLSMACSFYGSLKHLPAGAVQLSRRSALL